MVYICSECGNEFQKWAGQCGACGAWNSLKEVTPRITGSKRRKGRVSSLHRSTAQPVDLKLAVKQSSELHRIPTQISELDRVLGGEPEAGLVPGAAILLAGEPGIGKSTILGQVSLQIAQMHKVIYASAEESYAQVSSRLQRLDAQLESLNNLQLLQTMRLEDLITTLQSNKPEVVIVDSVQTFASDQIEGVPGSVAQVKEVALQLIQICKSMQITLILVGHVTKDGNIAGPRLLEHMVDVVLWFEGDRSSELRVMRAIKNRFGSTAEVGLFKMEGGGLIPVANPSEYFIADRQSGVAGSVLSVVMEGTRPIIIEIQALVVSTQLAMPRRVATGLDYNRLQMLIAVMTRRAGLRLGDKDVYVNVVGGLKITQTMIDAAVCTALWSADKDTPVPENQVIIGEIGLLGEIRRVPGVETVAKEIDRLEIGSLAGPQVRSSIKLPKSLKYRALKSVKDIKSFK